MNETVLYGVPGCKKCDEVKDYLTEKKIPFVYSVVGSDVVVEHLELVVSRRVTDLPIITINGTEVSFDYVKQSVEYWEQKKELSEFLGNQE